MRRSAVIGYVIKAMPSVNHELAIAILVPVVAGDVALAPRLLRRHIGE